MAALNPQTELLLEVLRHAFQGRAWHGTPLAGSIRGLSYREALWRPAPGRHNIWEIVLHTAYWKYAVRRRLTGGRRGSFARAGSNWPRLPADPDAAAWRHDVALLHAEHLALGEAAQRFPAGRLGRRLPSSKWTAREHLHGVAGHDLYHTGQIQLLKRLMRRSHS